MPSRQPGRFYRNDGRMGLLEAGGTSNIEIDSTGEGEDNDVVQVAQILTISDRSMRGHQRQQGLLGAEWASI